MRRIVVIGATGHFGGRISRRIAGEPGAELVVTSRSQSRAMRLADELRVAAGAISVNGARLDQDAPEFEADLRALSPDIVIHTAGPYQGQDYRVAEACIRNRSHYIDLADGRDFVQGFDVLDARARAQGVLLVTGASTLPGLSSVVIDSLRDRFSSIDRIEICIAPAHKTPRGAATVAAVLSYCGRPFRVLQDGHWLTRHGWQHLRIENIPGLGRRLSAACDVPDLGLLPAYVSGVDTVTFSAALEAGWEHISLWLMAWLTRGRIVVRWESCVPAFSWISDRLLACGSDIGGMQVRVSGQSEDRRARSLRWTLIARHNQGPEIPCTPALILARQLVAGSISRRGACPCLGMFSMPDIDREITGLDIDWHVEEESVG